LPFFLALASPSQGAKPTANTLKLRSYQKVKFRVASFHRIQFQQGEAQIQNAFKILPNFKT